jgi:hypothetical protein
LAISPLALPRGAPQLAIPPLHGKSWLAEAFAEPAGRFGYAAYCVRAPRLFRELHIARGDGSYLRVLARLASSWRSMIWASHR